MAVEEINDRVKRDLGLDDFKVCFHDDKDNCACRKPRPGLFQEAAQTWGLDLKASYVVGDRWRDVEAGASAGCQTIFIDYGYQEKQPDGAGTVVKTPYEAVDHILALEK